MTLERLKTVDDGFGDGTPNRWETVCDVAMQLVPAANSRRLTELVTAQQISSEVSHSGRSKFMSGVDSTMRLTYGQRIFHVSSVVNEMERNRFLNWQLIEVSNA